MNNDKKTSSQPDIWTVVFNGLVEAIKMISSIIIAIAASGAKKTNIPDSSTESEDYNSGHRNGHSGPGYYDSNDQKL